MESIINNTDMNNKGIVKDIVDSLEQELYIQPLPTNANKIIKRHLDRHFPESKKRGSTITGQEIADVVDEIEDILIKRFGSRFPVPKYKSRLYTLSDILNLGNKAWWEAKAYWEKHPNGDAPAKTILTMLEEMLDENTITCGECGCAMTLVRPGKHQCDNPNCVYNKQ